METGILFSAVLLFVSMFVPWPAPVGLAVVLWALSAGVPLPVVIGLYLAQDLLSFLAIRRLLPAAGASLHGRLPTLRRNIPSWLRRAACFASKPATHNEAGLVSAALVSFYAGAALAAVRNGAAIRSAAVVIAVDLAKYLNGLALALGATHILPASTATTLVASCAGLAIVPLWQLLSRRQVRVPMPIRNVRDSL